MPGSRSIYFHGTQYRVLGPWVPIVIHCLDTERNKKAAFEVVRYTNCRADFVRQREAIAVRVRRVSWGMDDIQCPEVVMNIWFLPNSVGVEHMSKYCTTRASLALAPVKGRRDLGSLVVPAESSLIASFTSALEVTYY